MPTYEYRCRTCDAVFERRRPMIESTSSAECPSGHADTVKLLSVFASVGTASAVAATPAQPVQGCGAACACHP